jgi:NTP pyrophosphatase (non-canonical NTP hydrolase)
VEGKSEAMTVQEFQRQIERLYLEKDRGRGWQETFVWFVEEVGELGRALRSEGRTEIEAEFADVFAWVVTLASIFEVDLETVAANKYGAGCPKCGRTPCICGEPSRQEA